MKRLSIAFLFVLLLLGANAQTPINLWEFSNYPKFSAINSSRNLLLFGQNRLMAIKIENQKLQTIPLNLPDTTLQNLIISVSPDSQTIAWAHYGTQIVYIAQFKPEFTLLDTFQLDAQIEALTITSKYLIVGGVFGSELAIQVYDRKRHRAVAGDILNASLELIDMKVSDDEKYLLFYAVNSFTRRYKLYLFKFAQGYFSNMFNLQNLPKLHKVYFIGPNNSLVAWIGRRLLLLDNNLGLKTSYKIGKALDIFIDPWQNTILVRKKNKTLSLKAGNTFKLDTVYPYEITLYHSLNKKQLIARNHFIYLLSDRDSVLDSLFYPSLRRTKLMDINSQYLLFAQGKNIFVINAKTLKPVAYREFGLLRSGYLINQQQAIIHAGTNLWLWQWKQNKLFKLASTKIQKQNFHIIPGQNLLFSLQPCCVKILQINQNKLATIAKSRSIKPKYLENIKLDHDGNLHFTLKNNQIISFHAKNNSFNTSKSSNGITLFDAKALKFYQRQAKELFGPGKTTIDYSTDFKFLRLNHIKGRLFYCTAIQNP